VIRVSGLGTRDSGLSPSSFPLPLPAPGPLPIGVEPLTIDRSSYDWGFEDLGDSWDSFKQYVHTNTLGKLNRLKEEDRDDPMFNFYTNKDGTTRVVCDFRFNVPEGALFPGDRTFYVESKPVESVRPLFVDWEVRDGTVALQPGANRFIFHGDGDSTNGQQWLDVTYNVPGGFGQVGQGAFCQLITANRHLYRTVLPPSGPTHFWNVYLGQEGADTGYPYTIQGVSTTWSLPNPGSGLDSPFQPLTLPRSNTDAWTSSTASDTFRTWAMYMPPPKDGQPTTWIPIGYYEWSWKGTATWNSTTGWDLTGTLPSGKHFDPDETIDHPTWSLFSPGAISFIPP